MDSQGQPIGPHIPIVLEVLGLLTRKYNCLSTTICQEILSGMSSSTGISIIIQIAVVVVCCTGICCCSLFTWLDLRRSTVKSHCAVSRSLFSFRVLSQFLPARPSKSAGVNTKPLLSTTNHLWSHHMSAVPHLYTKPYVQPFSSFIFLFLLNIPFLSFACTLNPTIPFNWEL